MRRRCASPHSRCPATGGRTGHPSMRCPWKKDPCHDSLRSRCCGGGGRSRRCAGPSRAALIGAFLSSFSGNTANNAPVLPYALDALERLPLITLPIAAAGVLSPRVVGAIVRSPVVRMNHNVGPCRIVISIDRMPAGRAGLIADDGRRRAISLDRDRSRAFRRARSVCLSGGRRRGCERRERRGGQSGNQKAFHRKLLWLDPPDPLDHAAPTLCFWPLFRPAALHRQFEVVAVHPRGPPGA